MPYPTRITPDLIMAQASLLIEAHGVEQFSLAGLADALKVKVPSLYRYVESKSDLLRLLNRAFLEGMVQAMNEAGGDSSTPAEQFYLIMDAYRSYAHANPNTYLMSFSYMHEELRPDEEFLLQMVLPLQGVIARIVGQEFSLAAIRGAFALVHGFVMLELTNQLRRGGNLQADFRQAVRAYLHGWSYHIL